MLRSVLDVLKKGPVSSKEIQVQSGLNQTAVSRMLNELREDVVTFKRGRVPFYALTRGRFSSDNKMPLCAVGNDGIDRVIAIIRPLVPDGFLVEPNVEKLPCLYLGEGGNGYFEDLPYYLLDLCPQGFFGRQIARKISEKSDEFPSNPKYWKSDHVGRFLLSNGEDLPGNLKLGAYSLIKLDYKYEEAAESNYQEIAEKVMGGEVPGSSAGGEQPKFAIYNREKNKHLMVKFSPKGMTDISIRWRDILITEHHASIVLNENGFPASITNIVDSDARLFLESERFDRIGMRGRQSMVSLFAIDNEFAGVGSNWLRVVECLYKQNLVDEEAVYTTEVYHQFGKMIGNTDMHLGNLSFSIQNDQFTLLPVYDMCSMRFAPLSNGEVVAYGRVNMFSAKVNLTNEITRIVTDMIDKFWSRVVDDERISDEFRSHIKECILK